MKTNTELLMNALGWQGGTVHQVARETGLTVMEILNLGDWAVINTRACQEGYRLATFEPTKARDCSQWNEDTDRLDYWRGVLAAMQQKESK